MTISYILFDACDTLIYKPALWENWQTVLQKNGYQIADLELQKVHKLLSEAIVFPDRTSAAFYEEFNAKILYALGIIPTAKLLAEIFAACQYLPWVACADTAILSDLNVPIGVLSNFNKTLPQKLGDLFGNIFQDVFVSEVLGVAKPRLEFYQKAIENIGLPANEILYIGDSLRLDIAPALAVGLKPLLIDRGGFFKGFPQRLDSLAAVKKWDLC